MKFTGSFNNINNTKRYTVTIGPATDQEKIIVDNSDLTGGDDVCFGPDPVVISSDMRDTFNNLFIRQATINLIANYDISDDVIANNYISIPVVIRQGSTVLFDGYAEPLSFSQAFNNKWNDFSITANDKLGILKYVKYANLVDLDNLDFITPKDVIDLIMAQIDKTVANGKLVYGLDNSHPMFNTLINPQIFIGDSEDDYMDCDEVINELGKIYGFYIWMDGDTVKCENLIQNYLTGNGTRITTNDIAGSDVNLTISEAFSRIKLECDISSIGSNLVDPFSEEFLQPMDDQRYFYMDEYFTRDWGLDDLDTFYDYITTGTIDYDFRDQELYKHYVQSMKNDQLDFGENGYDKQIFTGTQLIQWLKTHPGKGAFIKCGIGDNLIVNRDGSPENASWKNYLILQVNGKWDSVQSTNYLDTQLSNNMPIFTFTGGADNFTPMDEGATNYIIFNGTIILNKLQQKTGTKWGNEYEKTTNTIADCSPKEDCAGHKVHVISDGEEYGYYQHKYTSGISSATYAKLHIFDINKDYEYDTSKFGDHDVDLEGYLPLIACRLKIGDKYCVERLDLGTPEVYEWIAEEDLPDDGNGHKLDYFTLGMNPALGDYIMNAELKIKNNISNITTNLTETGTAIPIKYSDLLTGQFIFELLGPVNSVWNNYENIYHGWLWWKHREDVRYNPVTLLNECENVLISDFRINIVADNGTNKKLNNDLVYYSYNNSDYIDEKEYSTKFCTALTTDEANTLGIDFALNRGTILRANKQPFFGFTYDGQSGTKLEEARVYEQRQIWGAKKKELDLIFKLDQPALGYYPVKRTFSYIDGTYYTVAREIDLKFDTMANKLREK